MDEQFVRFHDLVENYITLSELRYIILALF